MKRTLLAFAVLVVASGCGKPTPVGYWEGKGKMREVLMKDPVRELTRSADYEFWFTIAKDGTAAGEIELDYDALLTVENLPSVSAGPVSFNPKVGGKISDLDPTRTFPLVGYHDGTTLRLGLGVPAEGRPPLKFTIRADPGVSAAIGAIGINTAASGAQSQFATTVDMTPFSPFYGDAPIEKRAGGPFTASYEQRSEKLVVEWSARQMGGEQREVTITPEMRKALEKLRSAE